jgi:ribosomal protein L32
MRKSANMSHGKVRKTYVEDKETGELRLPHHVTKDGFYKGRNVFEKPAQAS